VKLRFSPRAYADIADIHEYIAQHNSRAAVAVAAQIRRTSELLAQYPDLGRETDIPGVRVFPTARFPYLIYHKVQQGEVIVIHVRHGRRNVPAADEFRGA
jgi:toxin ParE1/3/4